MAKYLAILAFCAASNLEALTNRANLIVQTKTGADFGERFRGQVYTKTVTIKNAGTAIVTRLERFGEKLSPPFSFKGGEFPGTGGDCPSTILIGRTCKLVLEYDAAESKAYSDKILFAYYDSKDNRSLEVQVKGRATEMGCSKQERQRERKRTGKKQTESSKASDVKAKLSSGSYLCLTKQSKYFREFSVFVPNDYNPKKPLPLLFVFHGSRQTSFTIRNQSRMDNAANKENFLVVYPHSKISKELADRATASEIQPWRYLRKTSPVNDVQFVRSILTQLKKIVKFDPKQVYATGMAHGGSMAYRLACELSEHFSAIAPVGGAMLPGKCNPKRPVSIFHIHGTKDPNWPFRGGPSCISKDVYPDVFQSLNQWQKKNRCSKTAKRKETFKSKSTVCYTRSPCAEKTEVTLCSLLKHGSIWPGGKVANLPFSSQWDADCPLGNGSGLGKVALDFYATAKMFEFFKRHKRN